MKKALLLIDTGSPASYKDVLKALQALLADHLSVSAFEGPNTLTARDLEDCQLIISHDYADLLHTSESFASILISFVANGGGWLAMHKGTVVSNATGLTTLLGVKKAAELEETQYDFIITANDHPAMADTAPFTLSASAYQYMFSTIRPGPKQARRALLYEYLHNDTVCTGGWAQEFGQGRVAGSALDVNIKDLKDTMYAKIIKQCGLWAAGLERE